MEIAGKLSLHAGTLGLVLALVLAVGGCASRPPVSVLGPYRFPDGRVVSVRPSLDHTLRYREYETGRSGRLHAQSKLRYVSGPGFSSAEPVALQVRFLLDEGGVARTMAWSRTDGPASTAQRVGRERVVHFASGEVTLVGRLHLPDGPGPFPGIVLVHGSGEEPGTKWLYNGDFLVAHGIAVLAYDKRGTGASEGQLTFDFHQLARDAAAAVALLADQPEIRAERVGLSGYSQGGWVAPLAASQSAASLVLVSYGMIESPATEARLEMLQRLEDAGVAEAELAAADSLITAAVSVVASEFATGWEAFDELAERYRNAPWLAHLEGTPVAQMIRHPHWLVKMIGRRRLPQEQPWHYDSSSLLDTLCVPMMWLLGEEDRSAPNEGTIARLRALRAAGMPYDFRVFPGADHGMLIFREEGGRRVYTGYAPGYFQAEVEAARRWAEAESVGRPAACGSTR